MTWNKAIKPIHYITFLFKMSCFEKGDSWSQEEILVHDSLKKGNIRILSLIPSSTTYRGFSLKEYFTKEDCDFKAKWI